MFPIPSIFPDRLSQDSVTIVYIYIYWLNRNDFKLSKECGTVIDAPKSDGVQLMTRV